MLNKTLGLLLGVALFCSSCGDDSALCQYGPMVPVNMRIAEINPLENGEFDVILEFSATGLGDSKQHLAALRTKATGEKTLIDQNYIERNGLYVGFTLTGNASELTEGNCDTYVVSFDQNLK